MYGDRSKPTIQYLGAEHPFAKNFGVHQVGRI